MSAIIQEVYKDCIDDVLPLRMVDCAVGTGFRPKGANVRGLRGFYTSSYARRLTILSIFFPKIEI